MTLKSSLFLTALFISCFGCVHQSAQKDSIVCKDEPLEKQTCICDKPLAQGLKEEEDTLAELYRQEGFTDSTIATPYNEWVTTLSLSKGGASALLHGSTSSP